MEAFGFLNLQKYLHGPGSSTRGAPKLYRVQLVPVEQQDSWDPEFL